MKTKIIRVVATIQLVASLFSLVHFVTKGQATGWPNHSGWLALALLCSLVVACHYLAAALSSNE